MEVYIPDFRLQGTMDQNFRYYLIQGWHHIFVGGTMRLLSVGEGREW